MKPYKSDFHKFSIDKKKKIQNKTKTTPHTHACKKTKNITETNKNNMSTNHTTTKAGESHSFI